MLRIINTYRKNFAGMILTGYILFLGITIGHYHHFNIQSGDYYYQNDTNNSHHHSDGENLEFCFIHFFSTSINKLEINKSGLDFSLEDSKFRILLSSQILINSEYLQLKLLRAPPVHIPT